MAEKQNVTLSSEGRSFMRGGLNISWPFGGKPEVAAPPEQGWNDAVVSATLGENAPLVYTDEAATPVLDPEVTTRLITDPEEARKHRAIPPGPVITQAVGRDGKVEDVELKPIAESLTVTPFSQEGEAVTLPGTESQTIDYEQLSKGELEALAESMDVEVPPRASKAQIIEAIEAAETEAAEAEPEDDA